MATSSVPGTWPLDPYGNRFWPGPWAREAGTGNPLRGQFVSDQDLFFCFTDRGYAGRVNGTTRGYEIGARVEAAAHAFSDSYAEDFIFYDLALVNESQWNYQGAYLGVFFECWLGPFWGNTTSYLRTEYGPSGEITRYDLSYYCKDQGAVEFMRAQPQYEGVVIGCAGVSLLDTPHAPPGDGIDNDQDGLVDEPEGEKLGLTG
ncbi:MAG: hypothetical protein ONB06_04540, partial [candidate division KSB1 bacterium]|nr:hypothetical protein [candidate division KSB1 bacterium]